MRLFLLRLVAFTAFALFVSQSLADEWNVTRLRGQVLQLVNGEWQQLKRGSTVPDQRVIRTGGSGHVSLARGEEVVGLGPNTQVRIVDNGGERPFTTVMQDFGTVTVEAEVRNVQHFAVQNNYLAAVVKGTKFTVTASKSGASVKVARGAVFVEDSSTRDSVTVTAGQSAAVDKAHRHPMVSGRGIKPVGKANGQNTARHPVANEGTPAAVATDSTTNPGQGEPYKPSKPEKPGKTGEPEKPAKPEKPERPSKTDKPEKPTKPDNGDNGKGDKPDKGKPPEDPGKGKNGDGKGKGPGKD